MRIKYGRGDIVPQIIVFTFITLMTVVCLYPLLYVASMSISDPMEIARKPVVLLPRGFSLMAMRKLFENQKIWQYYGNTILYTVVGVLINVFMTVIFAYPLSRKDFSGRKPLMVFATFTMLFAPGLIPSYMMVTNLGLYNTMWALVLPGAISVFNFILARTFFAGLPDSLNESAKLDGANDFMILARIILPVSKAILSTLVIYYAVGHWNSYVNAMLYQPDSSKHSLQMFLVRILINNDPALISECEISVDRFFISEQLKYAVIVIAVLPIMCVYPFFQKHFAKGVMLCSLKE